jgi:hypothetical protein
MSHLTNGGIELWLGHGHFILDISTISAFGAIHIVDGARGSIVVTVLDSRPDDVNEFLQLT